MGVALLILDESVADHRVQTQIQRDSAVEKVTFQPTSEKTPNEKFLLQIIETSGELMAVLGKSVTLEEFEPVTSDKRQHWQIRLLDLQSPRLVPMQLGESEPNPIFAVYGLAHGVLPAEMAGQLQTFLCSGKVALMWRVLSRLLMQKWQFQRLSLAAYQLRQHIDYQN